MYDIRKQRGMHFFAIAFIKQVKLMYAMLRFSLARFSPVFSSSLVKSSQSAVRKFHQGIGAEPVKEISGGVVMRESLCCDLGYLSNIERSGMVPYI